MAGGHEGGHLKLKGQIGHLEECPGTGTTGMEPKNRNLVGGHSQVYLIEKNNYKI